MITSKLSNVDIQRHFPYSTMMVKTTRLKDFIRPFWFSMAPYEIFEIHRFRWGRLFLLHQNFRRLPKFRPSKSRKEKHECWSLFYAIACWIMASFALDWLLARAERRICTCLQRRKCLQNHTNFVKYANHEVTEFWACKKWARTVLAFLSLQK